MVITDRLHRGDFQSNGIESPGYGRRISIYNLTDEDFVTDCTNTCINHDIINLKNVSITWYPAT